MLYMYDILPYTLQQAKKLNVKVLSSKNPKYKIDVYDEKGKYLFSGGDPNFSDYPHYIISKGKSYANERRRLYHLRHQDETVRGKVIAALLW